ncbi:MAG: SRPBCC family protein [Gammaproteobacteria bacterium]|nr:SRPBCC family protein [Gammaproteobacteria bacterium]
MKVDIDKVFPIDGPSSNAWTFLQDIPGVAGCMPGAEITEKVDDSNYVGKVKVKVGPATMAFNGKIELQNIDAEKREMTMQGKGQDTKGSSSATMDLTASVRETANGKCEVVGVATITVTGKMASLGGRMMNSVADQILNQFGANFVNNVLAMGEGEVAKEAAVKAAEQPKELNGLAFAWGLIVTFFKNLFGGKK